MTGAEKNALVARLQAGKRAAKDRRPARLAELEAAMDALGAEYKALPKFPLGQERRREIRNELRGLGRKRLTLKYPNSEREA